MFWAENYRCWNQVLYVDTLCPLNCPVWDNFTYSFLHDKISSCIPCCLRHTSPWIPPTHLFFLCPLVMDLESLSQSTHLNRCWWQRFLNPRPSVGLSRTTTGQCFPPQSAPPPSLLSLKDVRWLGLTAFPSAFLSDRSHTQRGPLGGQAHSLSVCCCHFPFVEAFSFLKGTPWMFWKHSSEE